MVSALDGNTTLLEMGSAALEDTVDY